MNYLKTQGGIDRDRWRRSILLTVSAMSLGLALPAAPVIAAEESMLGLEEIIVTARRREEQLQDVPVSLTYFDQKQLDNVNMFQAGDIATYTPSLFANPRFGSDSTTFAIRGFSQELRTTASVGVYFAEVVAPRGANTSASGDGAGPGDMFDLENIQVLKGPQGTLFGRNTTGGAVLLTPKKPTDKFEGYAEASMGNYHMERLQGVLNIPVSDNFRMRFGVDQQRREGYLHNISGIGPGDFADIDYYALRASFVWDITEALENYTIIKHADSHNNGMPYSLFACNPAAGFGSFCQADMNRRQAAGNNDFYDVSSFVPNSESEQDLTQVINTTTWKIDDRLTLKNIFSYAEFESWANYAIYGTDWRFPGINQPVLFQMRSAPGFPTTDQRSLVEEVQLQGNALDDRLTWQAGVYFERSKPISDYGAIGPAIISCDMESIRSPDVDNWRCNNLLQAGSALYSAGGVTYENKAVYAEGTYQFTEQWSMTLGLRYTEDETDGEVVETAYRFPRDVTGGYFPPSSSTTATMHPKSNSDATTWVMGLEYEPTEDLMLYGKYSRGYRQGSVNLASIPEWAVHGPEKVDTYEIGSKSTFGGRFPGFFNIAAFYNDFENQQIQFGYFRTNGTGSTSILNSGKSTIWGIELDTTIQLTDDFNVSVGYAYLDTETDELIIPQPPYPPGIARFSGTSTAEHEPLPYAPKNKWVATANYRLPVDADLGEFTASTTYVYVDDRQGNSRATGPFYMLDSYNLFNFNLNWVGALGSPVDVLLFVTNAFEEKYRVTVTGNWTSGMENGTVGEPRMYGVRLRYNF